MSDIVNITLSQHKVTSDTGKVNRIYRLDKLVGDVKVFSGGENVTVFHVGDVLSESEAESVARVPHYRVTVVEMKQDAEYKPKGKS